MLVARAVVMEVRAFVMEARAVVMEQLGAGGVRCGVVVEEGNFTKCN